jgi:hypothetical protein
VPTCQAIEIIHSRFFGIPVIEDCVISVHEPVSEYLAVSYYQQDVVLMSGVFDDPRRGFYYRRKRGWAYRSRFIGHKH